jgi:tRNA U34 5-carboxymethylaminomethyl modifying enzyme MnmG/GidA
MTRVQQMSMDYHFKVEQESGSTSIAFFGYNGTIFSSVSNLIFTKATEKKTKDNFNFMSMIGSILNIGIDFVQRYCWSMENKIDS